MAQDNVSFGDFVTTYTTYIYDITTELGDIGGVFSKFIPTTAIPIGSWNMIHKTIKRAVPEVQVLLFSDKFTSYMQETDDSWKDLKEFEQSELKRMSKGKSRKKTFTDVEYINLLSMFVDKLGSVFDTWPTVKDEISVNIKQLRGVIIEYENTNSKNLSQPVKLWVDRNTTTSPSYIQINVLVDRITFDYTAPKTGEKDIDGLLQDIRDAFPGVKFGALVEQDVKGYFVMRPSSESLEYTEYIFMDMATNDEKVSKYLSKSELDKTDKKWYTIGYHRGGRDTVKPDLSFTVKPMYDGFGSHKVSIYDYQTKVSIKEFMSKFNEIMKNYETVFPSINDFYTGYNIVMEEEEDDGEDEVEVLDEEGEKWKGGSAKCSKKRSPIGFYTEAQARKKWEATFDKTASTATFEKSHRIIEVSGQDGTKQELWWVCNYEATPYLHIMPNNDAPCCYASENQPKQNKKTNSTYTKQTKQPLTVKGSTGVLNDSITFMNKYGEYYRHYIEDDIVKTLKSITGTEPTQPINMELAKQESWDKCVPEIRQIFEAGNIDYTSYATLLEETFKVNIVMYNETGLVLPNFKHGYFRHTNDYPFVLMYDQSQPEDPPSYVVIMDKSRTTPFITGIPEITETRLKNTINGDDIDSFDLRDALSDEWYVRYQKFDTYGKARRFVITNGTESLTIQTSPQQPFNVPERLLPFIEPYSFEKIDTLKKALPKMKGVLNGSDIVFSSPTGFTIDVPFNIPSPSPSPYIPTSRVSEFSRSIKLKRLARIVTENSIRAFADSVTDDDDFMKTETMFIHLINFANNNIEIMGESEKYVKKMTKLFSGPTDLYTSDRKIRVHSNQIKTKLLYGLQNLMIRNPGKLKEYKTLKFVPNFYKDSTDFIPRYAQSDQSDMKEEDILKLKDFNCASYDVFEDLDILIERK